MLGLCVLLCALSLSLSLSLLTTRTYPSLSCTTQLLLGAIVPVDAVGVAISTVQVVLVPIVVGMLANAKFPKTVRLTR